MFVETFFGNDNTKKSLLGALASGRLSHGIIINGEKGTGTNRLALLLAADITGTTEKEKQQVLDGTSSLVQIIEGEGASGQIKVNSVRLINENINFSSISGEKRAVIIKNCENFNSSSANALLKSLEEPKDDITFILTTNDISRLVATIRSRCNIYTLSTVSPQQCREYFAQNGFDVASAEKLFDIYGYNIGRIKRALQDPKRLEILEKAVEAYQYIKEKDGYNLSKVLFFFNKKKEHFKCFLQDLEDIASKDLDKTGVKTLKAIENVNYGLNFNANLSLALQCFATELVF